MTILTRTQKLEDAVFGNGKEGLTTSTTKLVDKVNSLEGIMGEIHADVKVLVRFQTQIETEKEVTELKMREIERIKKTQTTNRNWFVGLTTTVILGLIGTIITLIMNPKESKDITEQEFERLIEQYNKERSQRGPTYKNDTTYLESLALSTTNNKLN